MTMHAVNILTWAVLTFFPIASTVPIPPFAPRPLCNFQLALANQACAYLPSSRVSPPPPSPFSQVFPIQPSPPPPPPGRHEEMHSHGHKHGHSEGVESSQNQTHVPKHGGHGHHMHDHHKRVHGHHHKHKMSPVEQQCCKWLAQVDDECVCELLGRLPPFLVRPFHDYTVRVAGSCNTTYSCGAQFRL